MKITHEEFDRLLDEYMKAYGAAVLASTKPNPGYHQELEKAAEARMALGKAVFP